MRARGCRWFTRTYTDRDDEFVSHGLRFLAQSCVKALMPGVPQDRRDNVLKYGGLLKAEVRKYYLDDIAATKTRKTERRSCALRSCQPLAAGLAFDLVDVFTGSVSDAICHVAPRISAIAICPVRRRARAFVRLVLQRRRRSWGASRELRWRDQTHAMT